MQSAINYINTQAEENLRLQLLRCCGSELWVEALLAHRPFSDLDQLFALAEKEWFKLSEQEWIAAFAHHPRIGDLESLRKKFAATADWSNNEQSGVNAASEGALHALKDLNDKYFNKFGYIFIVFATGKTAQEMLAILEKRLLNTPDKEIKIAAKEHNTITRLRLEKLCNEVP